MSVSRTPIFIDMQYVETKDGSLTANSLLYNDELNQSLRQVTDQMNDGLQMPNATTAQIVIYRDDISVPIGTMWFNTNLAKLQVKTLQFDPLGPTPGVIETITSV